MSRAQVGGADFDALVGPHLEAGYRTALAILRDPDEARDAVQEAALKAWRKLGQLHGRGSTRPWFLSIVANQCRSVRRTRWWLVIRTPQLDPVDRGAGSESIDIDRALAKLTHDDRLALFLHFYLDLPLDEVGAVLGLSAAGAKTRVYRAAEEASPRTEDGLMDDLRAEIRAAFDKEQAAHPPALDLRRNVVEAVAERSARGTDRQWVAVVAAVLLGLLVVVGLMSTRSAHRATVPSNPQTSPHATPMADYGTPPAGVNLLYLKDPGRLSWLVGYDWSGKPRATLKLAQPLDQGYSMSMAPDGQEFQAVINGKTGSGAFFDRLGTPMARNSTAPTQAAFADAIWADDNRHLCAAYIDPTNYMWTLGTELPGEAARLVLTISRQDAVPETEIDIAACSFRSDAALLVRVATTRPGPVEVWVVRLSDGSVQAHQTYPSSVRGHIVASSDAKFIAENTWPGSSQAQTVIRRVADWNVVAALAAGEDVVQFSGDDSAVLVSGNYASTSRLEVMSISSGQVFWISDGSEQLVSSTVEPDRDSFALALVPASGPTDSNAAPVSLADVLIIRGDGSTTAIPGRYETTW